MRPHRRDVCRTSRRRPRRRRRPARRCAGGAARCRGRARGAARPPRRARGRPSGSGSSRQYGRSTTRRRLVERQLGVVRRLHLADPGEHRLGAVVDPAEAEVVVDALRIGPPFRRPGARAAAGSRRRTRDPAGERGVVERLDAELVAREHERAPLGVDEREGEHPDQPPERGGAPLGPGREQDLGVAAGDELAAERLELAAAARRSCRSRR